MYYTMMYHAVLFLGSNELGPVNDIEFLFATGALISSALLNALLFGDVASLVQVLSKRETAIQEKLDVAHSVMVQIEL